jgi:hypothetical protein
VDIPIEEQMDAYTTFQTQELFEHHGIRTTHQGLFTAEGQETRKLYSFTRDQLVDFLRRHADRAASLFERAQVLRGIYDKDVLDRDGERYVLYSQDHGSRREEKFYDDLFEAVADWVTVQYGMWLHDEV